MLRHSSKEDVSDVGGEGSKEETCEDGVSDVSNVGISEDTPKPPADCSNEMIEAVVIGTQKIHDNNTNTNHYPSQAALEPTQPTSPTPVTR